MTLEEFLLFEKENSCEELHIDDFYYWWYIRDKLILQCVWSERDKKKDAEKTKRKPSMKNRVVSLFRFISVGLKYSPFRKGEKNSLFILQDATVYNPEGGYYECPPTQTVVKNWEGKKTLISDYYTNYIGNAFPVQFSETTFSVWPILSRRLRSGLWWICGKDKRKKTRIAESAVPILKLFEKQYHCPLNMDEYVEWIYQQYVYWKAHYGYYERLILHLRPIGVVEQCWYSTWKMVFHEVAKKCKVPVIELQHGVPNLVYNSYIMKPRAFPDYVLLFSDFWKKYTNIPLPEGRILSVGYPYLEEQMLKGKKRKEGKKDKSRLLLVIGGLDSGDQELRKYLYEVCAYIKEKKIADYKIIYKMHPRFMNSYEELCDMFEEHKDILRVLKWNEKNLYDCFAIADEQISVSSMGIYEGIAYGLKTWVYQSEEHKYDALEDLCNEGYASFVNRPEQLFEREKDEEKSVAVGLWVEHSKERMMETIHQILRSEGRL